MMRITPLLAYGLFTLISTACAQSFPTKPIRDNLLKWAKAVKEAGIHTQ